MHSQFDTYMNLDQRIDPLLECSLVNLHHLKNGIFLTFYLRKELIYSIVKLTTNNLLATPSNQENGCIFHALNINFFFHFILENCMLFLSLRSSKLKLKCKVQGENRKNEVDSNVVFAQVGVTFHFHITSKTRGVRGSRRKKSI